MSTNAHGFLGVLEESLCFWGLNGDLGEKCTQKCAQNAYKKLAKVSKCHDLLAFVLICIHLYSFVLVYLQKFAFVSEAKRGYWVF